VEDDLRVVPAGPNQAISPSFEPETAILAVSALKSGAIWLVGLKSWLEGRGAHSLETPNDARAPTDACGRPNRLILPALC
jgi:hypothetical protein